MQLRSKLQSLDSRKEKNEKNNCRFFLALLLLTVLQNLIKGLILPNGQMPKYLHQKPKFKYFQNFQNFLTIDMRHFCKIFLHCVFTITVSTFRVFRNRTSHRESV